MLCYLRLCLSSLFASNVNIISVLAAESRDVNREGLYLNITLSFADTIYWLDEILYALVAFAITFWINSPANICTVTY